MKEQFTEQKMEMPKDLKRIIERIHFRDFFLTFFISEVGLSLLLTGLMRLRILPAAGDSGIFMCVVAYGILAILTFLACSRIYLRELSVRLYCKTAFPAYLSFMALTVFVSLLGDSLTVYLLTPLRLFRFSEIISPLAVPLAEQLSFVQDYSLAYNLVSILLCHFGILLVILLSLGYTAFSTRNWKARAAAEADLLRNAPNDYLPIQVDEE